MNTINPLSKGFVFSRKPLVTEPMIRSLLARLKQKDGAAKEPIIDFIRHRLDRRYIQPLQNISVGFGSGFLMIAASCLLIEALQSFHKGLNNTKGKGMSQKAFMDFFERKEAKRFFPKFRNYFPILEQKNGKGEKFEVCTFYKHIRCGVLHQAETTGGYRIVRDKSHLFDEDKNGKSINADKFVKALGHFLNEYFKNLSSDPIDSDIWKNAVKKITHICDNCRT